MKRWLVTIIVGVVAFILGALPAMRSLTARARHDSDLEMMSSARREQLEAVACLEVYEILEDRGADAAKFFCATHLALYYNMFRDFDDTHTPGRRFLLNQIKQDAEKYPTLKKQFDAVPRETPQSVPK
jgi:hypothetical protein